MPSVSIVLPTYNRADIIGRAIKSVLRQTFTDWELIIVDDGSTDNTSSVVNITDSRIRFVRQDNRGVYAARNTGLRLAEGRYITFLDSDDEWLPHYLALTTSFLDASSEDQFVMTELWVDYGHNHKARVYRDALGLLLGQAQIVGSHMLDLPSNETDDYLRIYQTREPLEGWGSEIAARAGYPDAQLYRGHIFQHYRWGYLGWLPTTMLRREALYRVGPFPEEYRTTADYRLLALLSREYRTNLIAVPCAIKHELGSNGQALAEDHLATGNSQYRFAMNRLRLFDELFYTPNQTDPEIVRVRGLYQLFAGRKALLLGKRTEAKEHFSEARRSLPDLWVVWWFRTYVRLIPHGPAAGAAYRFGIRIRNALQAVFSGQLTLANILHKIGRRLHLVHQIPVQK